MTEGMTAPLPVHDLYSRSRGSPMSCAGGPPPGRGSIRKYQQADRAGAYRHFRARPGSSLALREASEGTVQWTLGRPRERASRVLAIASEKVDPT